MLKPLIIDDRKHPTSIQNCSTLHSRTSRNGTMVRCIAIARPTCSLGDIEGNGQGGASQLVCESSMSPRQGLDDLH